MIGDMKGKRTVNFIRFLQQLETGSGDYTLERHQWLDQYTLDDLVQEIQSQRVEMELGNEYDRTTLT